MRPPRKPTGPRTTASGRPPRGDGPARPFRSRDGGPDRRDGPERRESDARPDRKRTETRDRPDRGPARDGGRDSARDGAPRPFRSRDAGPDRRESDARPDRRRPERSAPDGSKRPSRNDARNDARSAARDNAAPGKPARTEQPRVKRTPPPVRQTEVAPQRIAKALARAGVGSRRDIERMIAEGRIAIAGEVLTSPALNITSLAGITVDGEPVAGIAPAKLYRFHKPAGFLTAARDPAGRPTIMDILPPGLPRVVPVGRLDMNTEGLLLLTTDGELKRALELPSSQVPRVYRVRAFGEVTQKALEALADGVTIDGVHYGSILADIERKTGHNLWLIVTIREGKNREVRRVLEHVGLQVNRLIRVAYGPIGLDDLPPRMADEIPDADVALLRAMLKAAKPGQG